MASHQATRFAIEPKISHERAVHRIGLYLKRTNNKCFIFISNKIKVLECYVDVDFTGGWDKTGTSNSEAVAVFNVSIPLMFTQF